MSIQDRVDPILDQIEREHGVRILLAVESGSRAWGFESPDSDYDVRFIYAGGLHDYVRVDPPRDVIEMPIADDLDVSGWDILKAMTLFRKSNPPLLEWLRSPIVYRERGEFAVKLRVLAGTRASVRRMTYHYLSMAKQNYLSSIAGREQVSLKKYLYALRPLAAIEWLYRFQAPPPTSIHDVLAQIELPAEVSERLHQLMERKRQVMEVGLEPPDAILNAFIEARIMEVSARIAEMADPEMDASVVNPLLWTELGLSGA